MMKTLVCLFSLCLLAGCAQSSPDVSSNQSTSPAEETLSVTPAAYSAGQTLTIHVPDMHCPFACYPKAKEALSAQPGVAAGGIELVPQKSDSSIDDPRILVTLDSDVSGEAALKALAEVGFDKATIVAVNDGSGSSTATAPATIGD